MCVGVRGFLQEWTEAVVAPKKNVLQHKSTVRRCRYLTFVLECTIYSEVVVITMMWLKLLGWCSSLE